MALVAVEATTQVNDVLSDVPGVEAPRRSGPVAQVVAG